jgi:hypothetical protein
VREPSTASKQARSFSFFAQIALRFSLAFAFLLRASFSFSLPLLHTIAAHRSDLPLGGACVSLTRFATPAEQLSEEV